ncbi:hypothetical protein D3C77_197330 [compost metagenome]
MGASRICGVLAVHNLGVGTGTQAHLATRGQTGIDFHDFRLHVLDRVDVGPALRYPAGAQVFTAPTPVIVQVQRTGKHRQIHPSSTYRPTELVDVHRELQLLQAATELVEHHADCPIINVAHVAGHQLVWQACPGRSSHQLLPHEVGIVVATIWWFGELHLFPWQQLLHRARLKRYHRGEAVAANLDWRAGDGVEHRRPFRRGLANEAREEVRHLLAEQHRVVVVVEAAQSLEHWSKPWDTAKLAGLQGLKDVQHLTSGDPHEHVVTRTERDHIARVRAITPVRHSLPKAVELDPCPDDVARLGHLELVVRHKLRGQALQLKWHRQTILLPTWPQANETLAGLLDGARHQSLLAVEVSQLVRVGLIDPVFPQFLQQGAQLFLFQSRLRGNASTDQVAYPPVDCVGRVGVIAHRCPRAGTQVAQGWHNQAIGACVRGVPAGRAPPISGTFIAGLDPLGDKQARARQGQVASAHSPLPPW